MKILFVCHRFPYPPNRGGKIRSFNMIAHLAQKHSVVVASLAHTKEELSEGTGLEKYCDEIIAEVVPDHIRWLNAFRALPTTTPSSVAYFSSPRLQRRIDETIHRTEFDVVIVHCTFVAQYVEGRHGTLRILDYGDMDSVKWHEYAQHRRFPISWGYALEAKKLRDYERRIASRFDCCSVTTVGEREEFNKLVTEVPCTVVPNGVDTSHFKQNETHRSASPVIVFLGRMHYYPNIDGVCYFANEVFPLVREKVPEAKFLIVGSDPSRRVRNLEKISGIAVIGQVADVRTYVRDAAVSIAPLRIARGTQNKILESMAMGIPVVTTPQAAKGIQAVPGRDMLVAKNPHEFAEKVVAVLSNESLRRELSLAAQNNLSQNHTWANSMSILDTLLTDGMQQRSTQYNRAHSVPANR